MTFEEFERTIPFRTGWKREYYGGKAHVRPSWPMAVYRLELQFRPALPVEGLRPITPKDARALLPAFLESFAVAPEYCDYHLKLYRREARNYVDGFFGTTRGEPSLASHAVFDGRKVLAACLVKKRDGKPPLLDCLLVRPDYFRRGLATAVATAATNHLHASGFKEFISYAKLANEPSLAWHEAFGFREVPSQMAASSRCFNAGYELERLKKLRRLTPAVRERLTAIQANWCAELERIEKLPIEEQYPLRNL